MVYVTFSGIHDGAAIPPYGPNQVWLAPFSPALRIAGKVFVMPTISMFYGILIRMFFYDTDKYNVPHIHAEYQGQVAVYSIHDGTVLAGELPPKKHKLVVAWIEIHQDDLLADWQLAVNGKKPYPIRGLDQ